MLNDRELVHEDVVNHIQSCYMSRVYCGQQRVIKIVVVMLVMINSDLNQSLFYNVLFNNN